MSYRVRIYRSGAFICEAEGAPGETLHQCMCAAGALIDAPCGGNGICGKCLVRLSPGGGQALACRTIIADDMDVYLPDEPEMIIADTVECAKAVPMPANALSSSPSSHLPACALHLGAAHPGAVHPGAAHLGAAVDIGTTTVVAQLTDIETGNRIATASAANAQRAYGADVISRINYCSANGHAPLTKLIREQIASLISQACAESGKCPGDVRAISIAGNTVMQHLAAGYSPVGMGVAPYAAVSLFGCELPAWEGSPVNGDAKIYYAPAIASYVGGDVTAGMLASGLVDEPGPTIYLDIGTNGEIVLKAGGTYYCCATAAGPAFEGAEISMGMAAVDGAIDHVKWDGGLKLSVIGGKEPRGLCGSGLLDALAVLLETGAVDESGRLLDRKKIEHGIAKHIEKTGGNSLGGNSTGGNPLDGNSTGGANMFRLSHGSGGVRITAQDIRKLQLAKAAIAAGIQTLLRHVGIKEEQVSALILAGGFGSFMDKCSAARIGLFPESFLPITKTVGNAAGEGAAQALCSESARAALEDIRNRCRYIELSANPVFNEQFVEQMIFRSC